MTTSLVPRLAPALDLVAIREAGELRDQYARSGSRVLCSFNVDSRCRHALATVRCADCARHDALQAAGFFCDACFSARHPWTRAQHRFTRLHQPPPTPAPRPDLLPPPIRGAVDLLAATRAADASLGRPLADRLASVGAGQAATQRLLTRLVALVTELRDDGARERSAAARKIQGLYRRRVARRLMLTSARLLWGKILDVTTGRYYYVNRCTGASQWEPPVVFGRRLEVGFFPKILASKLSEEAAAGMIQSAWRGCRTRRGALFALARSTYRRCIDPATQREYFFNLSNGTSRWTRPTMLQGIDLPAYDGASMGQDVVLRARNALVLQRAWRAALARRALIARANHRWERLRDPVTRRWFHYDKTAHVSSWVKPLRLSLPSWQPPPAPPEPLSRDQALAVALRFLRMCHVRWRVQPAAAATYARYLDGQFSTQFWVHQPSGRSSWKRPALLLPTTELPVQATVVPTPSSGPSAAATPAPAAAGEGSGAHRKARRGSGGGSAMGGPRAGSATPFLAPLTTRTPEDDVEGPGWATVRTRGREGATSGSLFSPEALRSVGGGRGGGAAEGGGSGGSHAPKHGHAAASASTPGRAPSR